MSVKIMSRIWAQSRTSGGAVLVMLALGDFSNDEGESWPSVPRLAEKARLTVRQTQRVLRSLEKWGEIRSVLSNGGRNCRSHYFITLPENPDKITVTKCHRNSETVTSATGNGDADVTRIKPSKNRHKEREGELSFNGGGQKFSDLYKDWEDSTNTKPSTNSPTPHQEGEDEQAGPGTDQPEKRKAKPKAPAAYSIQFERAWKTFGNRWAQRAGL